MRDPPPSVIESWPKANYIDPETRGSSLLVVNVILSTLCFFAVTARLWARIRIVHSAGLDDILVSFSFICTLALTVLIPMAVHDYGWDRHVWDVPLDELVPSRKFAWIAQVLFLFSTCSTRISILLFYRRITAGTLRKTYLYTIYATITFIVCFLVSMEAVLLLGCQPLSAYWDSILPTYSTPYKCYDEDTLVSASGVISTLTDLFVVALPCYLVYGLQMPIRQKLSLVAVLCVGIIVCIAGTVRTVYIWRTVLQTYDETWIGYDMWMWTSVENDLAILCACAPALKPFFVKYLGSMGSRYGNSTGRNTTPRYLRNDRASVAPNTTNTISCGDPQSSTRHFGKGVTVTTELNVLESRADDIYAEDEESITGKYTNSINSTQDLSRNGARIENSPVAVKL